jgi:hypothetical protein
MRLEPRMVTWKKHLQNKVGRQKFALMIPNDAGDDLLVQISLFGGH